VGAKRWSAVKFNFTVAVALEIIDQTPITLGFSIRRKLRTKLQRSRRPDENTRVDIDTERVKINNGVTTRTSEVDAMLITQSRRPTLQENTIHAATN